MAFRGLQLFVLFACAVLGPACMEAATPVASSPESNSGGSSAVGQGGAGGQTAGGSQGMGGAMAGGGSLAAGGTLAASGGSGDGGTGGTAGNAGGGTPFASGGSRATGGSTATGGSIATGGANRTGGVGGSGSGKGTGGMTRAGGADTTASAGGAGGTATNPGECSVTVTSKTTSPQIATVAVVEWSTTLPSPSKAQIVYALDNASAGVLNRGGTAPVDLTKPNHRTLLLGLKPSSTYTFHVEATAADGATCKSADATLTTGTLTGAPAITRTAAKPAAQAVGFVISSGGVNHSGGSGINQAFIVDADGVVVWTAAAPAQASRARLDYEGNNMWMMALNVGNGAGEMRYVSMDGATKQNNVTGLSKAHHDFTILKGGIVATMSWAATGSDPESDLLERSPDAKVTTVFRIGANLYKGGPGIMGGTIGYHCNSLLYHASDDTYTIGDRNPSAFVKVSRAGKPVWQFGGDCSGAPAPKCVAGNWSTNHGHEVLDNGNFLFFNNGAYRSTTPSAALEYSMSTSATMQASLVKSYASASKSHSDSLGDVQRLPNGNTLVVFSNDGLIEEVDSSFAVVQTLAASSFGYADWRENLYGPPPR